MARKTAAELMVEVGEDTKTFDEKLDEMAANLRKTGDALLYHVGVTHDQDGTRIYVDGERVQAYSHRNGEMDVPAVEGFYFVRHPQGWFNKWASMTFVEWNDGEDGSDPSWRVWRCGHDYELYLDQVDKRIQWYGPVTPPWEREVSIPQDKVQWSKEFRRDLMQWSPNLPGRLLNAIRRIAASFEMLERATNDTSIPYDQWRHVSEEAMLVFGENGTLLPFDKWILILCEEPDRLLYIRDLGKIGAKRLLDAIDQYLVDL